MVSPITEPISIVDYNPYPETNTVDPQTWAELTQAERRQWIKDHTEVDLIEDRRSARCSKGTRNQFKIK